MLWLADVDAVLSVVWLWRDAQDPRTSGVRAMKYRATDGWTGPYDAGLAGIGARGTLASDECGGVHLLAEVIDSVGRPRLQHLMLYGESWNRGPPLPGSVMATGPASTSLGGKLILVASEVTQTAFSPGFQLILRTLPVLVKDAP
jgi:hypothetical protein